MTTELPRGFAAYVANIGIKDSTGDVAFMCRMMRAIKPHRPDFTFLTGWDVVLMPMLIMGVDGGTNATSGIMPELMRKR